MAAKRARRKAVPPLPDTWQTRAAIIATCRAMNASGINQGTAGNVSARVAGGMLITPSAVPYDDMTPDMIVRLPLDGPPGDGLAMKPSTEWRFHQALLAARTDMAAVVHAHPPNATALAVQGRPIPACHYMVAAFGGDDVPVAGYALFGGVELAAEVTRVMARRHGCLMAHHGATVLGETLERGLWRMEELEALARIYLLACQGGEPDRLTPAQMAEVHTAFASYRPGR
jgi:L-fuculose-phosphate aldolase